MEETHPKGDSAALEDDAGVRGVDVVGLWRGADACRRPGIPPAALYQRRGREYQAGDQDAAGGAADQLLFSRLTSAKTSSGSATTFTTVLSVKSP